MSSLSDLLSTFAIILAMVVCLMLCSIILAAILEFIEMRKKSDKFEGDVEMGSTKCHPEKRSKSKPEIISPVHIQIKRRRLFSVPMSKKKLTQNQASISPMKLKPVDLKLVLSFSSQLCQFYLDNRISLGSPYHLSEVIRKDLLHQPLLQHWRVHCHGRGAWLESEEPGRHIQDSNKLRLTVVEESQPLAI